MARSWYIFIDGQDATNISSYIKFTSASSFMCLCGHKLCVIYASGTERELQVPLSPNMLEYIQNALATGQIQPELPVDSKKYVYLKD